MLHIQREFKGKPIWTAFDEFTDSAGRPVAALIVGELDSAG